MGKVTLYSSSGRGRRTGGAAAGDDGAGASRTDAAPPARADAASTRSRTADGRTVPAPPATVTPPAGGASGARARLARHERALLVVAGAAVALAVVGGYAALAPRPHKLTQQDIDAAVLHTLENNVLPSPAAKAYEAVRRSVVRVRGFGYPNPVDASPPNSKPAAPKDKAANDKAANGRAARSNDPKAGKGGKDDADERVSEGVGSGVVIVDDGTILTNLHVVWHADRIVVEFADGMESEATVIAVRPEHDLAVLKAAKIPDDLPAATLRPTADLKPGDEVVAVGFPFGIGPSVSAGVVSGMRREHRSRGQADPDQPDPVRRGGQSGKLGRAAGDQGGRSRRHRHRDPQPDRPARVHRHRLCRADRERRRRCRAAAVLTAFQLQEDPCKIPLRPPT
jgi:serine protease DegQ